MYHLRPITPSSRIASQQQQQRPRTPPSPDLADPLTEREREGWRIMEHPPGLTEQERRRRECAAQPSILDSLYSPGGRRRRDAVAYSPNRRTVGFEDWSPRQIARENTFTPPPSPPPEVVDIRTQRRRAVRLLTRRLCELPHRLRLMVVANMRSRRLEDFQTALEGIEGRRRVLTLIPHQQDFVLEVGDVFEASVAATEAEGQLELQLREQVSTLLAALIEDAVSGLRSDSELAQWVVPLIRAGEQRGWDEHQQGWVGGLEFWYGVLLRLDRDVEVPLDCRILIRELVVRTIIAKKRGELLDRLKGRIVRWLNMAGIPERMRQGLNGDGMFWTDGSHFDEELRLIRDGHGDVEEATVWMTSLQSVRNFMDEQSDEEGDEGFVEEVEEVIAVEEVMQEEW